MKTRLFIFGIFFCSIFYGCGDKLEKEHDTLLEDTGVLFGQGMEINNRLENLKKSAISTPFYLNEKHNRILKEVSYMDSLNKIAIQKNITHTVKWKIHKEKHGCE